MFDQINAEVGTIAGTVGLTPAAWNAGVFSMIRALSDNVVVPVAGMILTFVLCYELISMIIDRNSFHDIETFVFFIAIQIIVKISDSQLYRTNPDNLWM